MTLAYSTSIIVGSLTYSPTIIPPASPVPPTQTLPTTVSTVPLEQAITQGQVKFSDLTSDGILWYGELPPGRVTPYAVLYLASGIVTSAKTTGYTVFRATYEISFVADTKDQAIVRASIARNRLNKKTLQDDIYSTVQTQTGAVYDQIAPGLGLNGADAWMASFSLEVFYSRI